MTIPDRRLALIRDYREEDWASMDLCADQLVTHVSEAVPDLIPTDLTISFRRRFQRVPLIGRRRFAFNADRLFNRHLFLPRFLGREAHGFDLFHIIDHTYAHAALALPSGRAGVYCHDLDAFRSLIEPERDPRPWWFRRLARRTLRGLQTAAIVFHNSREVGRQLLDRGLISADKLVHAPLGVALEFSPESAAAIKLPVTIDPPVLLHVGSNIPRKRIDVLLDVFAAVRKSIAGIRMVQVGGPWPPSLLAQVERLGIGAGVVQVRGLSREQLAELYRRAAVVLVPSESEGFGLPVIEALACGAVVIASDIPVLREVGGEAVVYCPVADVAAWSNTIRRVLTEPGFAPTREVRLAMARRYSWREHARIIGQAYLDLAARLGLPESNREQSVCP
jgi:glycosyltransferase involved in cell wall biosynthesis